ncbi:hypothetical protein JTT01_11935 [Clostridium botulinum]|nr:hypothetical protein [Clostridium botulinum]
MIKIEKITTKLEDLHCNQCDADVCLCGGCCCDAATSICDCCIDPMQDLLNQLKIL